MGFGDGSWQAKQDYEASKYPDASCPTRNDGSEHTSNYCAGYKDGYWIQWREEYAYWHGTENKIGINKQTIEQASSVNIKGDGNRVVVNQQANNGAQQPITGYPVYGSDGHDRSSIGGSQSNPRCLLLCANVRIN